MNQRNIASENPGFPKSVELTDGEGNAFIWQQDRPGARLFEVILQKIFGPSIKKAPLWGLTMKGSGSFFAYVLHDQKTIVIPPGALSIHSQKKGIGIGTQIQHIFEEISRLSGYNLVAVLRNTDEGLPKLLRQNGYFEDDREIEGLTYFIHKSSPVVSQRSTFDSEIIDNIRLFKRGVRDFLEPLEGDRQDFKVRVLDVLS